ncbi:MAG: hypothetical protein ACTSUV_06270 [Candidatus Ranarchaeia archaeon]
MKITDSIFIRASPLRIFNKIIDLSNLCGLDPLCKQIKSSGTKTKEEIFWVTVDKRIESLKILKQKSPYLLSWMKYEKTGKEERTKEDLLIEETPEGNCTLEYTIDFKYKISNKEYQVEKQRIRQLLTGIKLDSQKK